MSRKTFYKGALLLASCYCSSVDAFVSNPRNVNSGNRPIISKKLPHELQLGDPMRRSTVLGMATETSTDSKPKAGGPSMSSADSQNVFGVVSDAATGLVFAFLHAFDDCGIQDSSKNLRVLWVRALLNFRGKIEDDVAEKLLPKSTRGLVTSETGASLLDPILKFAEWIQARTEFIDSALDNFLSSPACRDSSTDTDKACNVVLFGAGYDTRALRYRHKHSSKINFIEVDLPEVVEGKTKLYEKFKVENDPEWENTISLVPFNLNDCGGESPTSLIETLKEKGGELNDILYIMSNTYGLCAK